MSGTVVNVLFLWVVLFAGKCDSFLLNKIPFKVAAFNIQHFGRSKMADPAVSEVIVSVISRFDLILVQEVRDNSGEALRDLWSRLNQSEAWTVLSSEAVGRKSYKEQYVWLYRSASARCVQSYSLPDPSDVYERPPFVSQFEYFSSGHGEHRSVVLVALHSRPEDAYKELVRLADDIVAVADNFTGTDGVLALGDFNADCRYVSKTRLSRLKLFNDPRYKSLVPHEADTTTGDSDCAYDRVIVYGDQIDARDAQVFDFQTEYGLDDNATMAVSDHFPIWFKLY